MPNQFQDAVRSTAVQRRIAHLREQYKVRCGSVVCETRQGSRTSFRWQDLTVILGVDVLDEVNGLTLKLKMLHHLLETRPRLRDRLVLIQITAVPSERYVLDSTLALQANIHALVGGINGRFGKVFHTHSNDAFAPRVLTPHTHTPLQLSRIAPVIYISKPTTFDELCALYCIADATLVTPIRAGSSLVRGTHVHSRTDIALQPRANHVCL